MHTVLHHKCTLPHSYYYILSAALHLRFAGHLGAGAASSASFTSSGILLRPLLCATCLSSLDLSLEGSPLAMELLVVVEAAGDFQEKSSPANFVAGLFFSLILLRYLRILSVVKYHLQQDECC